MIKTKADDYMHSNVYSTAYKLHLKYNDKQRLVLPPQIDF